MDVSLLFSHFCHKTEGMNRLLKKKEILIPMHRRMYFEKPSAQTTDREREMVVISSPSGTTSGGVRVCHLQFTDHGPRYNAFTSDSLRCVRMAAAARLLHKGSKNNGNATHIPIADRISGTTPNALPQMLITRRAREYVFIYIYVSVCV